MAGKLERQIQAHPERSRIHYCASTIARRYILKEETKETAAEEIKMEELAREKADAEDVSAILREINETKELIEKEAREQEALHEEKEREMAELEKDVDDLKNEIFTKKAKKKALKAELQALQKANTDQTIAAFKTDIELSKLRDEAQELARTLESKARELDETRASITHQQLQIEKQNVYIQSCTLVSPFLPTVYPFASILPGSVPVSALICN